VVVDVEVEGGKLMSYQSHSGPIKVFPGGSGANTLVKHRTFATFVLPQRRFAKLPTRPVSDKLGER